MKPRYCSSYRCQDFGCDYCRECSHAIFFGSGIGFKKAWMWEFNPMFGPLFIKKDGTPLKKQPDEQSSAWLAFGEWIKGFDLIQYRNMWG